MNQPPHRGSSTLRHLAGRFASGSILPTSVRAILGYYSTTGKLTISAIWRQRKIDSYTKEVTNSAFSLVEQSLAREIGVDPNDISFEYSTKLIMPAELTLGYIYQRKSQELNIDHKSTSDINKRVDSKSVLEDKSRKQPIESEPSPIERAKAVTELVIVALLDGDMRDAINDEEYSDFQIEGITSISKSRAAKIAQKTLNKRVEEMFDRFPNGVQAAYHESVEYSESHQKQDPYFRDLMTSAQTDQPQAIGKVQNEYKHAEFDDLDTKKDRIQPTSLFSDEELSMPYLKTQYGRVGVIYDGMVNMYRAAGIEIEDMFKRSIVFTIIGAQIWLDDIDDYNDDLAESQLTPVTAEYLLNDCDSEAYQNIVDIVNQYLKIAEQYAATIDSPLAGIGASYVLHSGNPGNLPGSSEQNMN